MASVWQKRAAIGAAVLVVALLAVPLSFFVRLRFFSETYDVPSIAASAEYQDQALLAQAWALPVAATLKDHVLYQPNGSICGPTSIADLMRSYGAVQTTSDDVLAGRSECWTGYCLGGITIDQLAEITAAKTGKRATVLRDLTLNQFRDELARSNDLERRYLINFSRGPLFAKGGGHHSPIGGYLADRDLVLVVDVNEQYRPWLVSSERLFRAMDTVDSSTGKKRGLVLVQ